MRSFTTAHRVLAAAGVIAALCGPAQAATITGVSAPNLFRPRDNVVYPFVIDVTGVYGLFDGGGVALSVDYRDDDSGPGPFATLINDPIHLDVPFALPGGPPGTPWAIAITLLVGCTTPPSEVFGPSGFTGEDPMMEGYFEFHGAAAPKWGYNSVTCYGGGTPESGTPRTMTRIPEPASLIMLALGAMSIGRRRS